MQRVGVLQHFVQYGVAGLMIGGVLLFLVGEREAATLAAPADFVAGFFEFGRADALQVSASGEEGGLIDDVCEFRAGETGRAARDLGEVGVFVELHFFGVNLENFFTPLHIGQVDRDLAVETSGAQQSGIEDIGAVGGGDDDDAFLRVEAVHFHEHGVERLFAFVVTAAHAVTAMTTNGVDFINEDEAGRIFFALLKHVAHTAGADTDEHLDKVRTADAEERHIRLARDSLGEKCFSCSGGAHHEDALGDFPAETLKLLGVFQKLDDLPDFFLRFFDTGNIFEGDFVAVLVEHLGAALAETERAASGGFHLLADEQEQAEQHEDREQRHEDGSAVAGVIAWGERGSFGLFGQELGDFFLLILDVDRGSEDGAGLAF